MVYIRPKLRLIIEPVCEDALTRGLKANLGAITQNTSVMQAEGERKIARI